MKRWHLVVMAVAAMWFAAAQAARAGGPPLDRPDLVDFTAGFVDAVNSKNMAVVYVPWEYYGRTYASWGKGQLRASPALATHGSIRWYLFEPDKTKRRKFSAAVQLQHSNYAYVSAAGTTAGGGFNHRGMIDGCKGKIKVTDADSNGTPENALWSMSCGKDVLTKLGMTEAEKAAFEKIFGSQEVSISGSGAPMPLP
jgi:hypothetical protein